MSISDTNLVWLDLEMTGLNPDTDRIIEIGTIITDSELNTVAEGPVYAVHQSESVLNHMDDWCKQQHGSSGLTQRVKQSTINEIEAEQKTLDFLCQYVAPGQSPLCGNSISQDRRFLYRYMPNLEKFFHYRNIDVSTIKELTRRWHPEIYNKVKKKGSHLVLEDIKESIAELKVYKTHFFD